MGFLLLILGISVYVVAIGTHAEAQAGGGTNCQLGGVRRSTAIRIRVS